MSNESFIRWQGRSLEELGKAVNLLLGLALATIGFSIAKILDKDFYFSSCYSKYSLVFGNLTLLVTSILFLFVTLNRLTSFKKTTKVARKREKKKIENIEELRAEIRKHDKDTWYYFKFGVWLFFIGELFVIIGFTIQMFLTK